jgi:DNA-binding SARP family transcriptional activator
VPGPIAVLTGGRELSMGRPRQRGLLGFLLLRAGTAVPVTRLIDALRESPPASATTQVQGCVSGIRRALRAAGVDGALRTDAAGYRLVVTVGELDLAVFDERSERARAALSAGRPAEAASRYRAALALWRGTPLAGAVGAYVNAAAARLTERRLDAWEDLAEAELAAGRADVVAAELRPLCDEHPLRERMSGRLMLALYRCGRRAEALAAYRRLHQALRDELGVEPSAEVAGLHAAILRRRVDGPAGNGPAAGRGRTDAPAAAGGSGCPGDREAQLAVLDGLAATRGAPVAVVTGMPGVGKTALVRHWAHRATTTWPTNMPAASSCTRSRRIRPRADRPPPSEYLIASA